MDGIWNLQTFHPIIMSPLLEMHLKCSSAPVTEVTTYFAFVLYPKPMETIQPIWNWLSIPAQGQIFGVVNRSISLLTFRGFFFNLVNLLITPCLFLSHQVHCIIHCICDFFPHFYHFEFFQCQLLLLFQMIFPKLYFRQFFLLFIGFLYSFILHVNLLFIFQMFCMILARQMVNICPISDVKLLTIGTVLPLGLIKVIVLFLPAWQPSLSEFFLKEKFHFVKEGIKMKEGFRFFNELSEICIQGFEICEVFVMMFHFFSQ